MQDRRRLLIVAILLGLAALLFLIADSEEFLSEFETQKTIDPKSSEVEDRVNRHLRMTAKEIEISELRAKVETMDLPRVGDSIFPTKKTPSSMAVDTSQDPGVDRTFEDLKRHTKDFSEHKAPKNVVQDELTEMDLYERRLQAAKEEYARQFLQNAKRGGYDVQLDENFVIVSVKKITNPNTVTIAPPDSGGAK